MTTARTSHADAVESPGRRGGIHARPWRALVLDDRHHELLGRPTTPQQWYRLVAKGAYLRASAPAVVVYRITTGSRQQTGIIAAVPVDDYLAGRIRRHEAVEPSRVREMSELVRSCPIEWEPVTLIHRPHPAVRAFFDAVTTAAPDARHVMPEGTSHAAWLCHDQDLLGVLDRAMSDIPVLYVADGHHRLAATASDSRPRTVSGALLLAAMFPSDEVRILGYHRGLPRPAGIGTSELCARLAALPTVRRVRPDQDAWPEPGVVAMYLDGRWFRLSLRRDGPDVIALESGVLTPLRAMGGARHHATAIPLPAGHDAPSVARWCRDHNGIGFLLHPPGIDDIMALADAGRCLPPKSTCFAVKPAAGMFVREQR